MFLGIIKKMLKSYGLVKQLHHHVECIRLLPSLTRSFSFGKSKKYASTEANEKEESISIEKYNEVVEALKKAKEEAADFKDKYVRSLAESENVRRRNKKMVEDSKLYSIQKFCKDLLEVADILEKATESVPKNELSHNVHLQSLFEGLTMTDVQLQKVFKSHGLEKVNPLNEKFDPNFHEAVFQLPGKIPGNVGVVQETGYRLHGRLLRAALVGVIK